MTPGLSRTLFLIKTIIFSALFFLAPFVHAQNLPPHIDNGIPNQHINTGDNFSYLIPDNAFKDGNLDILSYSASNLPSWLTFNGFRFLGTPGSESIGSNLITVTARDPQGMEVMETFTIHIHDSETTYAAFSMNTQVGCGIQNVQFINQSMGATSYEWNLGNSNFSNEENPAAIYPQPGTYTVSLTINKGLAGESTFSDEIKIFPLPQPKITALVDQSCEPAAVSLNEIANPVSVPDSTINNYPIESINGAPESHYYWYFFNQHTEQTTTESSIQLSDVEAGSYNVLIKVTDEQGCEGNAFERNLFEINPKPEALFEYTKIDPCNPSVVQFNNLSTISKGEIDAYRWLINGQEVSTKKNLSYNFYNLGWGKHEVSLQAFTSSGCASDVFIDTIKFIQENSVDFTYTETCEGEACMLQSIITGEVESLSWDLDNDGVSDSNASLLEHVFASSGIVPVTLTVIFKDGCEIVVQKNVPVVKVIADYNYQILDACPPEYTIRFTSECTTNVPGEDIIKQEWFLRQSGQIDQLISSDESFEYTFNSGETYSIYVKAESELGCIQSHMKQINLKDPTLDINFTTETRGCAPLSVEMEAEFSKPYDPAVSYNWTYGDGDAGTGISTNHTYAQGTYDVTLEVLTSKGCTHSITKTNAIKAALKPEISGINVIQDDYCISTGVDFEVSFNEESEFLHVLIPGGWEYEVELPDGDTQYTYHHQFDSAYANYEMGFYVIDNNCLSDTTWVSPIRVDGPKASFITSDVVFCEAPFEVSFNNNSETENPGITYLWNFGDDSISNNFEPLHTYDNAGSYTVILTVSDPITGCTDSYSEQLRFQSLEVDPSLISASDTTGCSPFLIQFNQNVESAISGDMTITSYRWDFNGDGIIDSEDPNPQYTYTKAGLYSVSLRINGTQGCNYYIVREDYININGPIVNFTQTPTPSCFGQEITFNSQVIHPTNDTANPDNDAYTWNFGNGNFSSQKSPGYTYPVEDDYIVTLTVQDENGCTGTISKPASLVIPNLEPQFTIQQDTFCIEQTVDFEQLSSGTFDSLKWDFNGDGIYDINTTDREDQSYVFASTGTFSSKLTIKSEEGCESTYQQEIVIIDGTAEFSVPETEIGCAPSFAYFFPSINTDYVERWHWDFGDGLTSDEAEPDHLYLKPGYYTVSLEITLKGGCTRSYTYPEQIFVDGPLGNFTYDNVSGCSPNEVTFTANNLNNVSYVSWDFGNGELISDTVQAGNSSISRKYAYVEYGETFPLVILKDDGTCGSYSYFNEELGTINTSTPPAANFSFNKAICQDIELQFNDRSTPTDNRYPITSWKWEFGDDSISTEQNTVHSYTTPGNYSVSLIAETSFGCSDTIVSDSEIIIYSNDSILAAFAIDDQLVCPEQTINFTGNGSSKNGEIINYQWNFSDNTTSSEQSPSHSYNANFKGDTIDIELIVTDDKLCKDTLTKQVKINNLQADFTYSPNPVFRGNKVDFTDRSVDEDAEITSYQWNFENGVNDTSTLASPEQIFYEQINPQNEVALRIGNSEGCFDSIFKNLSILNNPPMVDSFFIALLEDQSYTFSIGEFESNFDASTDPGQSMDSIRVEKLPEHATLQLNGVNIATLQNLARNEIPNLTIYPDENWFGDTYFVWNGSDGLDYALEADTVFVKVIPVFDKPELSDITYVVKEDDTVQIVADDFITHFTDADYGEFFSAEIDSVRIDSIPSLAQGILYWNQNPVWAGQTLSIDEIDQGTGMYFIPVPGNESVVTMRWNASDGNYYAENAAKIIIYFKNTPPTLDDITFSNIPENQEVDLNSTEVDLVYNDIDQTDYPFHSLRIVNIPPAEDGILMHRGNILYNNYFISRSLFESSPIRFIPAQGFEGSTQFTYKVFDGTAYSNNGNVFIHYFNQPPVNENIELSTNEDVPLWFIWSNFATTPTPFNDPDPFDELESFEIVTLPTNGILYFSGSPISEGIQITSGNIGQLSFVPGLNWNGNTWFEYRAFDGTDFAELPAQVLINVIPINDPPVAVNDTIIIYEDEVIENYAVGNNDSDVDNTSGFTYYISDNGTAAENGTFDLSHFYSTGMFSYTPNANITGTYSFQYRVYDNSQPKKNDVAKVVIIILPINDPPVINDDFAHTQEDVAVDIAILYNDFDYEGFIDTSSVQITELPEFGTATFNSENGMLAYTPSADYVGTDYLRYSACDQDGACESAQVKIIVHSVNDTIVAYPDSAVTYEDIPVAIAVTQNDYDHDGTIDLDRLSILENPKNGKAAIVPNTDSIWYTPDDNYFGIDTLWYEICDDEGACDNAWVKITVLPIEDAPVAINDTIDILEDENIDIDILANDYDPDNNLDSSSVEIVLPPGFGDYSIDPKTGVVYYQPNENNTENDQFLYRVYDEQGNFDEALVVIRITPLPDQLVALNDHAETDEEKPVVIDVLENDHDPDGDIDPTSLHLLIAPEFGTAIINELNLVEYIPGKDFFGNDQLMYKVCDNTGLCDSAYAYIQVNPINDQPVALNDTTDLTEDEAYLYASDWESLLANDYDVDGDPLLVIEVENNVNPGSKIQTTYGELTWWNNGNYRFELNDLAQTLKEGENITETFLYVAQDPFGLDSSATLFITIRGINDAPIALNDTVRVFENAPIVSKNAVNGLLSNDYDIEDETIQLVKTENQTSSPSASRFGVIEWSNDGSFQYTLNPENDTLYQGETVIDSIEYQIEDEQGAAAIAYLLVIIEGENSSPTAINDTINLFENELLTTTDASNGLLANDYDIDGEPINVNSLHHTSTLSQNGIYGSITWFNDGAYTYRLNSEMDTLEVTESVIDSFMYRINDQYGEMDSAFFYIIINGLNNPPTPLDDSAQITEDDLNWSVESGSDLSLLYNDYDIDGHQLSVNNIGGAKNGPINGNYGVLNWNNDGAYSYSNNLPYPVPPFRMADTLQQDEIVNERFEYTVIDEYDSTASAWLTIQITGINDAPIAINDSFYVNEDQTTLNISAPGILDNDWDIDDDDFVVSRIKNKFTPVVNGVYGTLQWYGNGAFNYAPNSSAVNFIGTGEFLNDYFAYQITDAFDSTANAVLKIIITGENDLPVLNADYAEIYEDTPSIEKTAINGLLSNDIDPESDSIWVLKIDENTDGNITSQFGTLIWNSNGAYEFQLNQGVLANDTLYEGESYLETFEYFVADINGGIISEQLTIKIIGENDYPEANIDYNDLTENQMLISIEHPEFGLLSNDIDIDGDSLLIATINDQTQTVNGTFGILSWTEEGTYEYRTKPEAVDSLESMEVVADTFTYVLLDQFGLTDTSLLIISISGINDVPVALNDTIRTNENSIEISQLINGRSNLLWNDFDADLDQLLIRTVNQNTTTTTLGIYGDLNWLPAGLFTYFNHRPELDTLFEGELVNEIFTYQIIDEQNAIDSATITVLIDGINDQPVAEPNAYGLFEKEGSLQIAINENHLLSNDFDIDGDSIWIDKVNEQINDSISGVFGMLIWNSNGTFRYELSTEMDSLSYMEVVIDSFEYILHDPFGGSDTTIFIIQITGENDSPIAVDDFYSIHEDNDSLVVGADDIHMLSNDYDIDGDPIKIASINNRTTTINGQFGTLIWKNDGTFNYYLNPQIDSLYEGETYTETFTYRLEDIHGADSVAQLFINIIGDNDPPDARDDRYSTVEGSEGIVIREPGFLTNDDDIDGDPFNVLSINQDTTGIVSGIYGTLKWKENGELRYGDFDLDSLAKGETVIDSFLYIIQDTLLASDSAYIKVSILGLNDKPIAVNDTLFIHEDSLSFEQDSINGLLANDVDIDGDQLQLHIVNNNRNGLIDGIYGTLKWNENGSYTYRLNSESVDTLTLDDPNAIDPFTYRINDGIDTSNVANFVVVIIPANDKPIAVNDTLHIYEDDRTINVLAENGLLQNDIEIEGEALKVLNILEENTKQGISDLGNLTWAEDGSYSFVLSTECDTLAEGERIEKTYRYIIEDAQHALDSALLVIIIHGQNDPPMAYNDSIWINEETAIFVSEESLLINDFDIDGDSLKVASINSTISDTIATLFGQITWDQYGFYHYLPNHKLLDTLGVNDMVVDSIQYELLDTGGLNDWATLLIIIEGLNDAPVALPDTITVYEDDTLYASQTDDNLLANDFDIDSDPIHVASIINSTEENIEGLFGTLQWNSNGSYIYFIDENKADAIWKDSVATDYFPYTIFDIHGDSATSYLLINIIGENDPPVAIDDYYITDEDVAISIFPVENDLSIDDPIVLSKINIVSSTVNGIIEKDVNQVGTFTYQPDPDFFGKDSAEYTIEDGYGATDTATIYIEVTPINDPPVAIDDYDTIQTMEYTPLNILQNDYDIDGTLDISTLKIITPPVWGRAIVDNENGWISYKTKALKRSDSLTYVICDDMGACDTAVAHIELDLEGLIYITRETWYNTPDTLDIAETLENHNLLISYTKVSSNQLPQNGRINSLLNDSNIVDRIIYSHKESDERIENDFYSIKAEVDENIFVIINIDLIVYYVPTAVNDTVVGSQFDVLEGDTLTSNDFDLEGDLFAIDTNPVSQPTHGSLTINPSGTFTFTPNGDFWGQDQFEYRICDSHDTCSTATVFIDIQPDMIVLNAINDTASTPEVTPINIAVIENDNFVVRSEDTLIISIAPVHGNAKVNGNFTIDYTPEEGYYGPDSIQYIFCDVFGQCDSAWVIIDVEFVNYPPDTEDDWVSIDFGESVEVFVLENDFDIDGFLDTTSLSIVEGQTIGGEIAINFQNGSILYIPFDDQFDGEEIYYQICDNEGACNQAIIHIQTPEQLCVEAFDDTLRTYPAVAVDGFPLLNDSGYIDTSSFKILVSPLNGSLFINEDASITYTPDYNFMGTETFTYEICTPWGCCDEATVHIKIDSLRIPQIITPNGDGKNDQLIIEGIENYPDNELEIYNRLGHLVYRRRGYNNTWEGYSNQGSLNGNAPLPTGTYYYVLYYNRGEQKQAGFIYIFR